MSGVANLPAGQVSVFSTAFRYHRQISQSAKSLVNGPASAVQSVTTVDSLVTPGTEGHAVTANSELTTMEVVVPLSGLLVQTEASIANLVGLPQGWDGYSGLPVLPEVAEHARRFLAAISESTQLVPDIVPLSDGGLQMEWFVGVYEVEVVIAPDGTAHVYFECTNDGRSQEFSLGASLDIGKIAPCFQELRR